jgi:hypothetical protein
MRARKKLPGVVKMCICIRATPNFGMQYDFFRKTPVYEISF